MKATKEYFPVVRLFMLYKVALSFEPVGKILKCNRAIKMKATVQYFAIVLCCLLYVVQRGSTV